MVRHEIWMCCASAVTPICHASDPSYLLYLLLRLLHPPSLLLYLLLHLMYMLLLYIELLLHRELCRVMRGLKHGESSVQLRDRDNRCQAHGCVSRSHASHTLTHSHVHTATSSHSSHTATHASSPPPSPVLVLPSVSSVAPPAFVTL